MGSGWEFLSKHPLVSLVGAHGALAQFEYAGTPCQALRFGNACCVTVVLSVPVSGGCGGWLRRTATLLARCDEVQDVALCTLGRHFALWRRYEPEDHEYWASDLSRHVALANYLSQTFCGVAR
jgi:hypothetical protein